MTDRTTIPLHELCREHIGVAGGKGANLGELTRAGVEVPEGFVVPAGVYFGFLEASGARMGISELLAVLDPDDNAALDRVAAEIQGLLLGQDLPDAVASAVCRAYTELGSGYVAVRSSATAEDLAEASFAGQQSTYLDVLEEANVLDAVRRCWASLFEARAIHYRARAGFDHLEVGIAVVIQRMVHAERSGIMFTINPVTGDHSSMIIEAVYGLGEAVVQGVVTPDMYIVEKATGAILERQVSAQEQELVRRRDAVPGEEPDHWLPIDFGRRAAQKLSDDEIREVAGIGQRLEAHFGAPQDIEWAWEAGQFYIVQARPVTAAG